MCVMTDDTIQCLLGDLSLGTAVFADYLLPNVSFYRDLG